MKEAPIQTAIEVYLRSQENQGNLVYIKNNSGAIPIKVKGKGNRYVRFGKKGSSDFLVFKKGRTLFLEVKTETGKQSANQKFFQSIVEAQSFRYEIVRSRKEAKNIVESFSL